MIPDSIWLAAVVVLVIVLLALQQNRQEEQQTARAPLSLVGRPPCASCGARLSGPWDGWRWCAACQGLCPDHGEPAARCARCEGRSRSSTDVLVTGTDGGAA